MSTAETLVLIMFAGGPGLVALVVQVWKHRSEKPVRDANVSQVLTSTATGLLEKMENRVKHLEEELLKAQKMINKLEAKLEAAEQYADELAREREQRRLLEMDNERLRQYLPKRVEEEIPAEQFQHMGDPINGDQSNDP